jgi:hypothetical protein
MKQDEIDQFLCEEIAIVPSTGFVGGVMDAVRREASAPPPIPFPWKRVLPGLGAGVLALTAMVIALVKTAGHATASTNQGRMFPAVVHAMDISTMYGIGWILAAILLTLVCVMLSMRLTTGSWRTL